MLHLEPCLLSTVNQRNESLLLMLLLCAFCLRAVFGIQKHKVVAVCSIQKQTSARCFEYSETKGREAERSRTLHPALDAST